VRVHRRAVAPLADQDEAIRVGDRRRERVPHAARLSDALALGLASAASSSSRRPLMPNRSAIASTGMARGYTRRPRISVEAAHCAGPLADTKDMTVGTGQAATALARAWHRARRSRFVRDCSGFTLTELVAVLAILPLVMIAVLSLSEITTTVGADDGERSCGPATSPAASSA
jgi:prepilin-type N-terminal cleavage/methylation domain-containing protein